MNIIAWSIIGLIIGVTSTSPEGECSPGKFSGTLTLVVLSGILGGVLGDLMFKTSESGINLVSIIISATAAAVVLTVHRMAGKEENSTRLSPT